MTLILSAGHLILAIFPAQSSFIRHYPFNVHVWKTHQISLIVEICLSRFANPYATVKIKDMCMRGCIIICHINAVGRLLFKGQCHKIFCFRFLSRGISSFLKNSWRYSQVKVHHWYQRLVLTTPAVNLPSVLLLSLIPVANLQYTSSK